MGTQSPSAVLTGYNFYCCCRLGALCDSSLPVCGQGLLPHTQAPGFSSRGFNSFHPSSKKSGCTLPSQTAPTNRFTFNFPIKFTGTYRVPLFHFLMACAVQIVSRTFLHALGIPSSLELPFQARLPLWRPQHALPSQNPGITRHWPLLISEPKGAAVTCLLGDQLRPPLDFCGGELWRLAAG